jgi:hypothetical protein
MDCYFKLIGRSQNDLPMDEFIVTTRELGGVQR